MKRYVVSMNRINGYRKKKLQQRTDLVMWQTHVLWLSVSLWTVMTFCLSAAEKPPLHLQKSWWQEQKQLCEITNMPTNVSFICWNLFWNYILLNIKKKSSNSHDLKTLIHLMWSFRTRNSILFKFDYKFHIWRVVFVGCFYMCEVEKVNKQRQSQNYNICPSDEVQSVCEVKE